MNQDLNSKYKVTAWVSPMAFGSKVTFSKPIKPEDEDERVDWYCEPLFGMNIIIQLESELLELHDDLRLTHLDYQKSVASKDAEITKLKSRIEQLEK